jgi:hypothetical protein
MIELTSAVVLLVSSLYGPANVALAQDVVNSDNTDSKVEKPVTLEKYVQDYFDETPILAKISKCESHYRQFDADGKILRGKVNSDDVGLMQINEHFHEKKATELGLDLETIEGNLAYAKYLYEKEGTKPWSASSKCWKK